MYIKYIVSFYEAQKNLNAKQSQDILNCFIEVMTKEEFDKKLNKYTKKEKENIKSILEKKFVQPKKKMSSTLFLTFILGIFSSFILINKSHIRINYQNYKSNII